MTNPLKLFPTYSSLELDTPKPLLPELERAGREAAAAFDAVLTAAKVSIADPHSAEEGVLRRAVRAFELSLWNSASIPRATRRAVAHSLPDTWDWLTVDARNGRFGDALLSLETSERRKDHDDDAPAKVEHHPVTAYVDRVGQRAAEGAFAAHADTLRGGGSDDEARAAARSAFVKALASEAIGDAIELLRGLDSKGFWITVATGAAGLFASFLLGPRALLRSAERFGVESVPISADFDVAVIDGRTKVRIGLGVVALPGALAEAKTWQSVFRQGVGASASLALDFGSSELTARAEVSPGEWGVRFGFSGVFG